MSDSKEKNRDRLWDVSFKTMYDVHYLELLSGKLVAKWSMFDDTTKVLIALTASGSAISGWVLWQAPYWKWLWLMLAGAGSILSIINASLGVPNRVKDWVESKKSFAEVRVHLESLRYEMEVFPTFDLHAFHKKYTAIRQKYQELYSKVNNDILITTKMRNMVQQELNEFYSEEIGE